MTANPDNTWMKQHAKNALLYWDGLPKNQRPTILVHDFDDKYTKDFDAILKEEGIKVQRVGPRKPNLNPFAERFVQSAKHEALDHFICFGMDHLRHICTEYVDHYNQDRPHQGLGGNTITPRKVRPWKPGTSASAVVFAPRLGGLLKSYQRRAG
jgi:putative transposase